MLSVLDVNYSEFGFVMLVDILVEYYLEDYELIIYEVVILFFCELKI